VDSKVVTSALRRSVRPTLRSLGFSDFTGRYAWRHASFATEVVCTASLGPYRARGPGPDTPHSFVTELGVFLHFAPTDLGGRPIQTSPAGTPRPREYTCHLRSSLPGLAPTVTPDGAGYVIGNDESQLDSVIEHLIQTLRTEAEEWFLRFRDAAALLHRLQHEELAMEPLTMWGCGRLGSPMRGILLESCERFLETRAHGEA